MDTKQIAGQETGWYVRLLANRKMPAPENGISHRLDFVGEVKNVGFINDSKATDINATWYSLDTIQGEIVWIAGLSDTEMNWSLFREVVSEKVKALIVLGNDAAQAEQTLGLEVSHFGHARNMSEAVNQALSVAQKKDIVLFSPACPAFDMFHDYKERGTRYIAEVKRLECSVE